MELIERIEGRLTINSRLESLAEARCWLRELAERAGFSPAEVADLNLVLSEACSNVIRHAYGGKDGHDIILSLSVDDEKLLLSIQDFGRKFELESYQPPELDTPHEGGYGIYIIHQIMDEVEYDTSPPQGTILRMTRLRRKDE